MARQKLDTKQSVYYRQFRGGYTKVPKAELRALLEGYKRGLFRRNEVRVYAAQWEQKALHAESRVSLYRILNAGSFKKGNRRLSRRQIDNATAILENWLPVLIKELEIPEQSKPVARRILRHVAKGGSTTVESLFYFAYFMQRIPPRKPMYRLNPDEHYARFRYSDFQDWTGVHRTSLSRLLTRILERGLLNIAEVHKQNENAYGQLYIDGPMLSLVRPKQSCRRLRRGRSCLACSTMKKKTTPIEVNVNTPMQISTTLIKGNLKTEIKTQQQVSLNSTNRFFASHQDPDLRRIAMRARQMTEETMRQVA